MHLVVQSPSADVRLERARAWLSRLPRDAEAMVVGASLESANELLRADAATGGGRFGVHRASLVRWAGTLATGELARLGLTPIGGAAIAAVCARVVHSLERQGALGRFAAIADRPGLPRAIGRTLAELRGAAVDASTLEDADLRRVLQAYEGALERARVIDRAGVFALAARQVQERAPPPVGRPVVFLDVPIVDARTQAFVAALAARTDDALAVVPSGDDRSARAFADALACDVETAPPPEGSPTSRLQARLFSETPVSGDAAGALTILSAPGESRECVEIARRIHREAERGVAFDRMAVLLHAPHVHRAHLVEALRRAQIPACWARGALRPDPSGRALLALLACAAEGLSATRFAEYLSLGECPDALPTGEPPEAPPAEERVVPPDEEMAPEAITRKGEPVPASDDALDASRATTEDAPVVEGTLRTPRLFERLLVDAKVLGGLDRWERRLAGLRGKRLDVLRDVGDPDDPIARRIDRDVRALDVLRAWALPLLRELAAFPASATWGVWINRLSALSSRALRRPERVQSALAELSPMADVGPVELTEVRLALERRLGDVVVPETNARFGRVLVATPEEARGLSFDVVFVPGLAEKLFPQKITEDPLLPDAARARLSPWLQTNVERSASERLALRLAVGAARVRVVASYPRLDVEQSRPRTPSFYGLELLRAAEGALPGFDALARRAEVAGGARIGWPAPARTDDAIDEGEHDLALLDRVLRSAEPEAKGTAAYLLDANPHLARALRFRARRWHRNWFYADGMITKDPVVLDALAAHALARRSFSPTALQHFSSCPYKFFLHAVHRLAPREVPAAVEELDPMQRGTLIHETQYALFVALRREGLLPVRADTLEHARALLDDALKSVEARWEDDLAPAIRRVWDDAMASIRADLREWLRRTSEDVDWTPTHAELSFGLPSHGDRAERDPRSVPDPVPLESGLRLRGSIDLVEVRGDGAMRATDHKTGKAWAKSGTIIGGGETLQPALYALALEKMFGARVEGGRLYYCTAAGEFTETFVPLDDLARDGVQALASAIDGAIAGGFLPAAPAERACDRCDYVVVCGPHEERRTARKKRDELAPLVALRRRA